MITTDAILFAVICGIVFGAMNYISRRKREAEAKASIDQRLRLDTIAEISDQVEKLQKDVVRDTKTYREAKEKYDQKWRNPNGPTAPNGGNKPSGG